MSRTENINRIISLTNELKIYCRAYYNDNHPLISDEEYDKLFDELSWLEDTENFFLQDSPTKTVGSEISSELKTVKHSHQMMSLDKTKDVNELVHFAEDEERVLSCKLDGLTILLTYRDGKLFRAETRGRHGIEGEDVTHNAMVFENIPLVIDSEDEEEIEGEAIITYSDFERINIPLINKAKEEAYKLGLTGKDFDDYVDKHSYKNPRNLVSGSVRQLDSNVAMERHIRFVAWKQPKEKAWYMNGLSHIVDLGFDVVPAVMIDKYESLEKFESAISYLQECAAEYDYPIDGEVLAVDNVEHAKAMGVTGHHPKHSIAYKFYDEEVQTTLLDIDWTVKKAGIITPTAIFDPVKIEGTTVERASLSNLSVMYETLGVPYVGQTIYVTKRGKIIPKVERAEKKYLTEETDDIGMDIEKWIRYPLSCPICGEPTEQVVNNSSAIIVCTNEYCQGKLLGRLQHFVSKEGMDIDGISEKTLEILIDKGWLTNLCDIYELKNHKSEWIKMKGFSKKSVEKMITSIEQSKTTTLDHFISALCIKNIGLSTAKTIAKFCEYDPSIFIGYTKYPARLMSLDGIADRTIEYIKQWRETNKDRVSDMIKVLTFTKPMDNNSSLANLTFCFTGKFEKYTRDMLKEIVEMRGGKVSSGVSKATDYLVTNDKDSGSKKNQQAAKFGTKIIDENEFNLLITNAK